MPRVGFAFLVGGFLALAPPAGAQESFTIQVTIPPLGAAVAAQESGAVGSWTVLTPGRGLMMKATNEGGVSELEVYRSDQNRFVLFSGNGRALAPLTTKDAGGLTSLRFRDPNLTSPVPATTRLLFSAL